MKKIAICVPSGRQVEADMAFSLAGLCSYSIGFAQIALFNEKSSVISRAREHLAERGLESGADFIMFIDSDMRFPADGLRKLVNHDKDVVAATYKKRVPPFEILGHLLNESININTDGLFHEASFLPGGFMLIKAEVLRTVPKPWFFEQYNVSDVDGGYVSEDYGFCMKARQNGFHLWCDLELSSRIGHIGESVVTMELPEADRVSNAA